MKRNECLYTLMKLKMEHNSQTEWMSTDIDGIKMEHNCETKWMSIYIDEIKDGIQLWNEMKVYRHWWN